MAREGMADLIAELRRLTNAGTADYTVGSTTYWSDDQLQSILDRYRETYKTVPLQAVAETNGASNSIYLDYVIPTRYKWIEASGSVSGFALLDSTYGTVSSGFTVNYDARRITFTADTSGSAYFLNFRAYDMHQAAADVWEDKAASVWDDVDWRSDNHQVAAAKQYDHCIKMARKYRGKSGGTFGKFVRVDVK